MSDRGRYRGVKRILQIVAVGQRSVTYVHPLTGKAGTMPRSTAHIINFKKPAPASVTFLPLRLRGGRKNGHWPKRNLWGYKSYRSKAGS